MSQRMLGMFEIGQLITIPFPFSDMKNAKPRPVIVISLPDDYGDFICLAVTSKPQHVNAIAIVQADMQNGTLPLASWVRTDKVYTLNISIVIKTIGQLQQSIFEKVLGLLCSKIGCH